MIVPPTQEELSNLKLMSDVYMGSIRSRLVNEQEMDGEMLMEVLEAFTALTYSNSVQLAEMNENITSAIQKLDEKEE